MKPPALKEEDLIPWLDKAVIIRLFAGQVKKDLGSYGLEIIGETEDMSVFENIFRQVQPFIAKAPEGLLREILYRVDVEEDKAMDVMQSGEPYSQALTRLILLRELQKVVIRYLFSGK